MNECFTALSVKGAILSIRLPELMTGGARPSRLTIEKLFVFIFVCLELFLAGLISCESNNSYVCFMYCSIFNVFCLTPWPNKTGKQCFVPQAKKF